MRSYHDVEQELLAQTPNGLKFDGFNFNHTMTLGEFLKEIFQLSKKYNTVTNNNFVNSTVCVTFCSNRSLGDIFLLAKYYFPNTTLKEVRETLLSTPKLVGWYCLTINDFVYNVVKLAKYDQYELNTEYDRFGWTPRTTPPEK